MSERPTSGMLPASYPMARCRLCGHWSYLAGVLDDPVCLGCRNLSNAVVNPEHFGSSKADQ